MTRKSVSFAGRRSLRSVFATTVAAAAMFATTLPVAAEEIPAAAKAEADTVWATRCTTCHGAGGKGDGPAGAALTPRPRDLSSAEWQKGVTDAHIEKVIVEGGQSVGLSMMMTANPDLASKPDVVKALRAHVRGLAGK